MKSRLHDFWYSMGSLSSGLSGQAVSAFAMFYYIDVLHVPAKLIGIAWMAYGIWNAINDPLFGHISDHTRTRWGRRIPYIKFLYLPLALAFVLLWTPPFHGNTTALFYYFFGALFVFDGLFTIVVLNWTALFPEMYTTLQDRTRVSAWRQVLGIVGMILGIALSPMIYGTLGWTAMAVMYGAIIALGFYLSLRGSHEDPKNAAEPGLPLFAALKATYANWSFLSYVIASALIQFTFSLVLAMIPFYSKYVLQIGEAQTSLLLGAIFVTATPLLYVWSRLTARFGAKTAIIATSIVYGAALVPFLFVKTLWQGVATTAAMGLGLAGILLLLDVLISDVIDEDEVRTGRRREGMYFGINGFMIRLGVSLTGLVSGLVLDRTGYNADLAVQPPAAVSGLRLLVGALPVAAVALAILLLLAYPLSGARLSKVHETLKAKQEG
jgi:GPH family glycoside/pentoside/hexuronide:cation symporter